MKTKNTAGNWLDTLLRLIDIIKTEYPEGGKFPSVPEMSSRLKVAENTYCKALRAVCEHGLAHASPGRGGTVIIPPVHRITKIGVLTQSMLSKSAFTALMASITPESDLGAQLVEVCPEKLIEKLLIQNIDGLYAINPKQSYFPALRELNRRNFPLAIVEFYNYSTIEKAMEYKLPYFHIESDGVAEAVYRFAAKRGLGEIMVLDRQWTILCESFKAISSTHGRTFSEKHFMRFSAIDPSLVARVKKLGIELIYAKCNPIHAEAIGKQLLKLPAERRPQLILSEEVRAFMEKQFPQIKVAGYFDIETETYRIACRQFVQAIRNHARVKVVKIDNLAITSK